MISANMAAIVYVVGTNVTENPCFSIFLFRYRSNTSNLNIFRLFKQMIFTNDFIKVLESGRACKSEQSKYSSLNIIHRSFSLSSESMFHKLSFHLLNCSFRKAFAIVLLAKFPFAINIFLEA